MSETTSAVGRLLPGVAVVEVEDGVAVTGGPRRQHFRGKAAKQVLPGLLRLLDGTHSRDDICQTLGLTSMQLAKALSVLDHRGLLDHAPGLVRSTGLTDAAAAYYSRVRSMAGYRETSDLTADLADSRVVVIGGDDVAAPMAQDLVGSGVGTVVHVPRIPPGGSRALFEGTGLAVVVWTGHEADGTAETAVAAAGMQGTPVLRVLLGADHLEFGPYLLPGYSVCLACLERGRHEAGWDLPASRPVTNGTLQTAVGLAAAQAVSFLLGGVGLVLDQRIVRTSVDSARMTHVLATPYPGCQPCGTTGIGDEPTPESSAVQLYEWAVRGAPLVLQSRQSRSQAEQFTALESERPRLSSHPGWLLPEGSPPVSDGSGAEEDGPVPAANAAETFGELLRRVGGLRKGDGERPTQRWTPSGGNLGSVELYVVGDTGRADLPEVAFRYDDIEHRLIAVRPDLVTVDDLLTATDLRPGESYDAVIALVAAFGRTSQKYRAFAHRLAHLDAGVAMTQLDTVAAGYGWQTAWAESWDEKATELLGLHAREQLITAIAGIRHQPDTQDSGGSSCR
ncbi:nitroreductase family protein [Streptomyces sp. MAR4 CNX-425]|uniref:nitroreductase family protein n=1 Tax=Streptomyces sp. MAR4 CNX-425 TaxID=3406343 RepID=UPI003B511C3B